MNTIESVAEEAALAWPAGLGYSVLHGPAIAFGEPGAECDDPGYRDVVLARRLRRAVSLLKGATSRRPRKPAPQAPAA